MTAIAAKAAHYAITGAILYRVARAVNDVFAAVARRRTLRELSALNDYQLADIGLRRDQLTTSVFQPSMATRHSRNNP